MHRRSLIATSVALALASATAAAQGSADIAIKNAAVTLGDGATALPFKIVRRGDTGSAAAVRYGTVDGTAKAGVDYRPAAGVAVIPAGQSSVTVPITVLGQASSARRASALGLRTGEAFVPAGTPDTLVFTAAPSASTGQFITGIATADFDGDGKLDLALADSGTGTVDVLQNSTAAHGSALSFLAPVALGMVAAPGKPAACDLNNDGKPDIVAATSDTNRLTVQINTTAKGAPALQFQRTDLTSLPWGYMGQVACADFDGDGKIDIAGAGFGSSSAPNTNRAIVFRNTSDAAASTPTFAAPLGFAAHPVNASSYPNLVAVADFNGDGRPDIALGNANTLDVTILLNTTPAGSSDIAFAAPVAFTTLESPADIAVLDIDGNGRPDLVTVNSTGTGGATWTLLLNRTPKGADQAAFTPNTRFVGGTASTVAVADVDLDGRDDVLVGFEVTGDSTAGSVGVLLNRTAPGSDDPSFVVANSIGGVDEPHALAAGDFNQDGLPDFVVTDFVNAANPKLLTGLQTRATTPLSVDRGAVGRLKP